MADPKQIPEVVKLLEADRYQPEAAQVIHHGIGPFSKYESNYAPAELAHAPLPDLKTMPPHIQALVEEMKSIDDPLIRLEMAHHAAEELVKTPPGGNAKEIYSMTELAKNNFQGTCTAETTLKSALMRWSGTDASNIYHIGVRNEYSSPGKQNQGSGQHDVLGLQTKDQVYISDGILDGPAVLKADGTYDGYKTGDWKDGTHSTLPVSVKIAPMDVIPADPAMPAYQFYDTKATQENNTPAPSPENGSSAPATAAPGNSASTAPPEAAPPSPPPQQVSAPAGPGGP